MNSRCFSKPAVLSSAISTRQSVRGHVGSASRHVFFPPKKDLIGKNVREVTVFAETPDEDAMKAQYDEAMKNPEVAQKWQAMEDAMKRPEVQQQMQQTMAFMQSEEMQKKMQALQEDEELKPMFDEIKKGGVGAFMKFFNNTEMLKKLGEKMGPMPTAPPPTEAAQAPPSMPAPPEAEINDIVDAAKYGDLEAVEDFLAIGKDPNSTDDKERTPLHFAAATQHMDIIDALIGAGANTELSDIQKNTPLHYAAGYGREVAARRLLDNGANAGVRNATGKTPFDLANLNEENPVLKDEDLIKTLEEAAANSPVFQDQ